MAVATNLLSVYRSPSGPSAGPWAEANARHFRGLDLLSFPPNGLWTEPQYTRELMRTQSDMLGVWDGPNLVAFTCSEHVFDETHMLSLAVHPDWRGHGLARMLVLSSLWAARAAGHRLLTLEVRMSNAPAIALYRSCGLGCVGTRPKYYRNPAEDALLLSRSFEVEGSGAAVAPQKEQEQLVELEALVRASGASEAVIRRAAVANEGGTGPQCEQGELLGELIM